MTKQFFDHSNTDCEAMEEGNVEEIGASDTEEEDTENSDRETDNLADLISESDSDSDTDTDGSRDMFGDEEDTNIQTYLALNKIEDLIKNENDLDPKIKESRLYRREKKRYFTEHVTPKSVPEVLSQLSQIPEAVRNVHEALKYGCIPKIPARQVLKKK